MIFIPLSALTHFFVSKTVCVAIVEVRSERLDLFTDNWPGKVAHNKKSIKGKKASANRVEVTNGPLPYCYRTMQEKFFSYKILNKAIVDFCHSD